MLTYFQEKHDETERDERSEDNIQFVIARRDSPEVLQMMEQTLDFVPSCVELLVIFPGFPRVRLRRYDRNASFASDECASHGIRISLVHDHCCFSSELHFLEQFSSLRRIALIAGAEDESQANMRSGSDQMDLRRQSSA